LVSDGVPWVDIVERECSIVIIANRCSRSNETRCEPRRVSSVNVLVATSTAVTNPTPMRSCAYVLGAIERHEDRKGDQNQYRSRHEHPPRERANPWDGVGAVPVGDTLFFARMRHFEEKVFEGMCVKTMGVDGSPQCAGDPVFFAKTPSVAK